MATSSAYYTPVGFSCQLGTSSRLGLPKARSPGLTKSVLWSKIRPEIPRAKEGRVERFKKRPEEGSEN